MKLGEIIQQYRKDHGLSLRAFAEKCGVSNAYLSMLESGRHPTSGRPIVPTLRIINKIADAMGLTLDELLINVEDMPVTVSTSKQVHHSKFSHEEITIIKLYREADPEKRNLVKQLLAYQSRLEELKKNGGKNDEM